MAPAAPHQPKFTRLGAVPSHFAEDATVANGPHSAAHADALSFWIIQAYPKFAVESVPLRAFRIERIANNAPAPKDAGLELRALENYVSDQSMQASDRHSIMILISGESRVQAVPRY